MKTVVSKEIEMTQEELEAFILKEYVNEPICGKPIINFKYKKVEFCGREVDGVKISYDIDIKEITWS